MCAASSAWDEGGWERLEVETKALEETRAHVVRLEEEIRERKDAAEAAQEREVKQSSEMASAARIVGEAIARLVERVGLLEELLLELAHALRTGRAAGARGAKAPEPAGTGTGNPCAQRETQEGLARALAEVERLRFREGELGRQLDAARQQMSRMLARFLIDQTSRWCLAESLCVPLSPARLRDRDLASIVIDNDTLVRHAPAIAAP